MAIVALAAAGWASALTVPAAMGSSSALSISRTVPDARGQHEQRRPVELVERLERVGIDDRHVLGLDTERRHRAGGRR